MSLNVFEKSVWNWRHPIRKLKNWKMDWKFARQRVRRGYCDSDWWDLDNWLLEVLPNMLEELADKADTYPGYREFDTFEKWQSYLRQLACDLRECSSDAAERMNEYSGTYSNEYFARAREIKEYQDKLREDVGVRLFRVLPHLWD